MKFRKKIFILVTTSQAVKGSSGIDLSKKLNEQRADLKFCDAHLRVNGETIGAHRCVLAAVSEYFKTMFFGVFGERSDPVVDLSETFTSSNILKCIIDFIYGEELTVTKNNVSELLGGADFLLLHDIKALCLEFLLEIFTPKNCLWTWSLAYMYSLDGLNAVCEDLAILRFHDCLIDLEDTLSCPPDHLKIFLNKGLAMHCSVAEIKSFIEKYVNYDPSKRNQYKKELQKCAIRSRQQRKTPQETVVPKKNKPDLGTHSNVQTGLPLELSNKTKSELRTKNINFPRKENTTECLIVMKSWYGCEFEFLLFSPFKNKWYQLCVFKRADRFLRGLNDNIELFSVGTGTDKNMILFKDNVLEKLILMDIFTSKKRKVRPLPSRDVGAPPKSTYVETVKPFSSLSRVYCLSERRQRTGINKPENKGESVSLYLHRLDIDKNKWKRVCLVEKGDQEIIKLHLLYHFHENFYIFVMKESCASLYRFNGLSKKIKSLKCLEPDKDYDKLSEDSYVYGSPNNLTIASKKCEATYNIKTDNWIVHTKSEDNQDKLLVRSHTRNEGYVISKGVVDLVDKFTSINMSNKTKTQLATLPKLRSHLTSTFTICRVPFELLTKLKSPESKCNITESECLYSETPSILTEYRKKHNLPVVEKRDSSYDSVSVVKKRDSSYDSVSVVKKRDSSYDSDDSISDNSYDYHGYGFESDNLYFDSD